jgi:hypothetical protein
MRHLWSLLAGVVAAPLAWLGLAAGQFGSERLVARWQEAGRFDTVDLIGPVLFLLAVGILLGLVGTLRWSPAGPLAAGILLMVPTVFMFINPFDALDAFSYDETSRWLSQDLQLWRPLANGTLLVLGTLLLMSVFSRQRWQRWPGQAAPVWATTDQEPVAGEAGQTEPSATMGDDQARAGVAATGEPEAPTGRPDEPASDAGEPAETTPRAADGSAPPEDPDNTGRPSHGSAS